eukprot:m.91371 g.91371  ORF g.91371 m.91371 type:complete len:579 (+) comp36688_c0_seq2:32-1768(+)
MDEERVLPLRRSLIESERQETSAKWNLVRLLLVLLLERLGFYIVFQDLSYFATNTLGFSSGMATALSDIFLGTSFAFPVLFGALSDRKLGYYPIITGALTVYPFATGTICYITYAAKNSCKSKETILLHKGVYAASLGVVALCSAAVNATIIPYMLEQVGEGSEGNGDRKLIKIVCPLAYGCVNVGTTVATSAALIEHFVKPNMTHHYLISPAALLLALAILLLWRKQYANHSAFVRANYWPNIISILATGFGCYRERRQLPPYDPTNEAEEEQREKDSLRRRMGNLVSVLGALIIYYTVYSQMTSSFFEQAKHISFYKESNQTHKRNANGSTTIACTSKVNEYLPYKVPSSILLTFDTVAVLIALPTIWLVIQPLYKKIFKKEVQLLQRIHWGMIMAFLAIFCALVLELIRRRTDDVYYASACYLPECENTAHALNYSIYVIPYSNSVSMEYLIPQYALIGFSEALANTGATEFALSRAPREFRCTAFSFYFAFSGMGTYFSTLLIFVFNHFNFYFRSWEGKTAHFYKLPAWRKTYEQTWPYYVSVSGLMLVSILVFAWVRHKHKDITPKQPMQTIQ